MIGDTTCTGLLDFDRYFSLQGRARELFVCKHVPNAGFDMAHGVVPITRDASIQAHRPVALFESVICRLTFSPPRSTSIGLCFEFFRDAQTLVAAGYQTIVFADAAHRLVRIPSHWRQAAEAFPVEHRQRNAYAWVKPLVPVAGSNAPPSFEWSYRAVLGDTNAVGNVYFARLAELVSAARDAFVFEHVDPDYSWTAAPRMSVEQAMLSYHKDFFAGDPIRCALRFESSSEQRIELHAELRHGDTDVCHVRAWQAIAFLDADGRRTGVPDAWRLAARPFR
jgi:acyl-CoA thioesterase FadM